jgi:hypothetical protein
MNKKRRLWVTLLVVAGIGLALIAFLSLKANPTPLTQEEVRGEQIILAYIEARHLNIRPGRDEYQKMMKGILLGEYPDLTGKASIYATTPADRDAVIDYAATHMRAGY